MKSLSLPHTSTRLLLVTIVTVLVASIQSLAQSTNPPTPGDEQQSKVCEHWLLRGNIDNELDDAYVIGAQSALLVDPNPPRTVSVGATYTF